MIQSHLKIIVLKSLEDKTMTGYDLVKEIHTSTQHWKPSFGSIYPLLKDLHEKGLVSVKVSGRKKLYSLTPKGRQAITDIISSKERMYNITMDSLKGLESICNKKDMEFIHRLHSSLRNNFMPFKGVTNEMHELNEIIIRMSDSGVLDKNEKNIKKMLNDSIIKLKKIEGKR